MAILPSNFLSFGITSNPMKYESNLQINKTTNGILSLPKYVSLKNDSYLNNINPLNLEKHIHLQPQTVELSLVHYAMFYISCT